MKITESYFLEAYDQYADAIFRYCFYRVYDRELARDLMQEVFARAWRRVADGEHIDNIRAFLYTVARNIVIDHSRRKKAISLDELMEQGFDTGTDMRTSITNTVDVTLVLGALDQFDQVTRDLITLRYIEGWRVKDIAQSLGISQTSASVRLHRAMHILKRQLAV